MAALDVNQLQFIEKNLFVPPTNQVISALSAGLKENFADVTVDEIECPDLASAPFHLASSGLNGSPTLLEIGGPTYLLPLVDRTKVYELVGIVKKVLPNAKSLYVCGAGAGPHPSINSNCEAMINVKINENGSLANETYISKVAPPDDSCVTAKASSTETRFALLGNLYLSEGANGKVIHVLAKKRTGARDFITTCREAIHAAFAGKHIGIGGMFLIKKGKVRQHVMRDFSKTPIHTEEDLNNWLAFYEMPATLTAVGTFVTDEMDLDLRLQHFHSFSQGKWGGHYHYDTTPDEVEYEAFFNVAERVVRIDPPANAHKLGRD